MDKRLRALIFCLLSFASPVHAAMYFVPALTYHSVSADSARFEGIGLEFAVGYGGWNFFSLDFAAEAFISPFKAFQLNNNSGSIGGLAPSSSYGISILPGIALDRLIHAFARLGVVWTHFDGPGTGMGLQGGIGADVEVMPTMTLRGEFDYTRYNSLSDAGRVNDGQFKLGIVYCY